VADKTSLNESGGDLSYAPQEKTQSDRSRHGIGVFTLLAGIATLFVSVYVLSDGADWFPHFDVRWMLAGGAALVGVLILATSLRSNRK
jgi:hypothetical protein